MDECPLYAEAELYDLLCPNAGSPWHTIDDLKQCLARVRRHLAPSGRLFFDISKWDLAHLPRDPTQRYPVFAVNQLMVEESALMTGRRRFM